MKETSRYRQHDSSNLETSAIWQFQRALDAVLRALGLGTDGIKGRETTAIEVIYWEACPKSQASLTQRVKYLNVSPYTGNRSPRYVTFHLKYPKSQSSWPHRLHFMVLSSFCILMIRWCNPYCWSILRVYVVRVRRTDYAYFFLSLRVEWRGNNYVVFLSISLSSLLYK